MRAIAQARRVSLLVWMDEIGWGVPARLHWLWAAVAGQVAVFAMQAGRGLGEAAALLGADYHGVLHPDGWRPYYTVPHAVHQNCVGQGKGRSSRPAGDLGQAGRTDAHRPR